MKSGESIGPYKLVKKLGSGSFGDVWQGLKDGSSEAVAVKIIKSDEEDEEENPMALMNGFLKEVHTWSAAGGHPNVHTLGSPEVHDGKLLLVSACADQSLSKWLRDYGGKAPSVESTVRMMSGILTGLEHLHTRTPPILHRDLKPDNILLFSETPRLADFGVSRMMEGSRYRSGPQAGTEVYSALKTYNGEYLTSSDLWSCRVILYEMLMGHLPFPQRGTALMGVIINGKPLPLTPELPQAVCNMVTRCLAKDPKERFASAKKMCDAIHPEDITYEELRTLKAHTGPVPSVIFSPDGKRIVTGGEDKTAKVWNADTGAELRTIAGHKSEVISVAFSPDGRKIVTGSGDGTAKVWSAGI